MRTHWKIRHICLSLDPWALPHVNSLEACEYLPDLPGIYFALDESAVHYIGKSTSIVTRMYGHPKKDDFRQLEDFRLAFLALPELVDDRLLHNCESWLIKRFSPFMNKVVPAEVPYQIKEGSPLDLIWPFKEGVPTPYPPAPLHPNPEGDELFFAGELF